MERPAGDQETGIIPFQEFINPDFGIADFIDNESNLDQFIDQINATAYHDPNTIANFSSSDQIFAGCDKQLFGLDDYIGPDHCSGAVITDQFQNDPEDQIRDFEDDVFDEEDSSETTTTTSASKRKKGNNKAADRSRTLMSDRRRRGRMKEKLYALRALVPYITKMDKASIVGDAVLYVQDLQLQAKKLKSEIAGLDLSLKGGDINNNKYQGRAIIHNSKSTNNFSYPTIKKIIKMDVFQVEEQGFYVRIVSEKGRGGVVYLYKALESLTISNFKFQSSNLADSADNYVFTFTLHVTREAEVDMDLQSLKLWIASIFLNQGFEFETSSA